MIFLTGGTYRLLRTDQMLQSPPSSHSVRMGDEEEPGELYPERAVKKRGETQMESAKIKLGSPSAVPSVLITRSKVEVMATPVGRSPAAGIMAPVAIRVVSSAVIDVRRVVAPAIATAATRVGCGYRKICRQQQK
jgi:hypothetical protein